MEGFNEGPTLGHFSLKRLPMLLPNSLVVTEPKQDLRGM